MPPDVIKGVYRVYCRQWLVFHTSVALGAAGDTECFEEFTQKYEGRVLPLDWRIEAPQEAYGRSMLLLQVPNGCGEFTDEALAWARAGEHGHEGHPHQVVLAGSAEERELQAYGTRRLRGE
jgi:hypothetical protein